MRDVLKRGILRLSARARAGRGRMFRRLLQPTAQDKILDLGGYDGSHIASVLPGYQNIWVADINAEGLERAASRYGFHTALLREGEPLPFADHEFDIVFCSSVIEHVTIPKSEVYLCQSGREFKRRAFASQQAFAAEVRRVGKRYFVQTPYKYFMIESHTWMPMPVIFLPRPWLIRLLRFSNRRWIKATDPDWNLLTFGDMRRLFPDAHIMIEWWMGLPKSIIAYRR
jgi:hypothetical protein